MGADTAMRSHSPKAGRAAPVARLARMAGTAACLLALLAPAGAQAQSAPGATPPAAAPDTATPPAVAPPAAAPPAAAVPAAPATSPPPAVGTSPAPVQIPEPPRPPAGGMGGMTPMPGMPGTAGAAPAAPLPPTATPVPDGHGQTVFGGEGAVLTPVPVVVKTGSSSWDDGYDSIVAALNAIAAEMTRLGLTQAGEVFVVYTQSDDAGFEFEAQIPFSGATTAKPQNGVRLGASFNGKALRFQHKGSFADMDDTYEQIANFLDARNITALENLYIEQYRTDPRTTPPDQLLVDILVPVR